MESDLDLQIYETLPQTLHSALGAASLLRNHLRGEKGCWPERLSVQASMAGLALSSRELEREQESLAIRVSFGSLHCLLWSQVYFFSLLLENSAFHERGFP